MRALALMLLVATAHAAKPPAKKSEPLYDGKTMAAWLEDFRRDDKGRMKAGAQLVKIGAPAALPLASLLDGKENSVTRASAASNLWQLRGKGKRAVKALEKSLNDDPDMVVRLRAAQALTGIVGPAHKGAADYLNQTANSKDPMMQDWMREEARTIMFDAKVEQTAPKR